MDNRNNAFAIRARIEIFRYFRGHFNLDSEKLAPLLKHKISKHRLYLSYCQDKLQFEQSTRESTYRTQRRFGRLLSLITHRERTEPYIISGATYQTHRFSQGFNRTISIIPQRSCQTENDPEFVINFQSFFFLKKSTI